MTRAPASIYLITPPFWRTWYAIIFSISLVIVSLLLMFKRYALIPVEVKNKLLIQRIENEKKEELNQLKLAFFTNISHEFRTPLTLVVGPLEKMLKKYTRQFCQQAAN
jgi:signal transduction histidine kinase